MPRGPVLTLIAVFLLTGVLFGVNTANSIPTPDAVPAPTPAGVASPAPAAPASTAQGSTGAPAAARFPSKARYSGRATPSSTPVTIWVEGDRARVYVCDNADIEAWLTGSARAGVVDATGEGGARLDGRYAGGTVTGSVRLPGHPQWSFSARPH